jgi:hypothetical protein
VDEGRTQAAQKFSDIVPALEARGWRFGFGSVRADDDGAVTVFVRKEEPELVDLIASLDPSLGVKMVLTTNRHAVIPPVG